MRSTAPGAVWFAPASNPVAPARRVLVGYAAVFGVRYHAGGWKVIRPGAFDPDNTRADALLSHRPHTTFAGTNKGTLQPAQDDSGLLAVMTVDPATQYGREAVEGVRSGRYAGMSFTAYRDPADGEDVAAYFDLEEVSLSERPGNPATAVVLPDALPDVRGVGPRCRTVHRLVDLIRKGLLPG